MGDLNARIVFYGGNEAPVGLAFVELRTRATMDAEGGDAHVLQVLGYFHNVFAIVVPAEAGLHGDGQGGATHAGGGEAHHQVHVFEYGRAGAFAHNLFHRTAEVNVQQIWPGSIYNAGAHGHGVLVAPKNLDANWALVVENVQLLPALDSIADEAFAADELSKHKIGAVILAHGAEGRVAHVFHWRKQQRKIGEGNVGNIHGGAKVVLRIKDQWLMVAEGSQEGRAPQAASPAFPPKGRVTRVNLVGALESDFRVGVSRVETSIYRVSRFLGQENS